MPIALTFFWFTVITTSRNPLRSCTIWLKSDKEIPDTYAALGIDDTIQLTDKLLQRSDTRN